MPAQRRSSRWLVAALSVLVVGLILCLTPAVVSAQGGGVPESSGCSYPPPSSCLTCHAQVDPVAAKGEWHIIHARNDFCRNCHGGDDRTMDKDQAHAGMIANPLDDTYLSCHACHTDYQQRAEKFAVILGVTPQSHKPITTTAVLNSSNGVPLMTRPTVPTSNSISTGAWWLLGLLAIAALLLAGVTVTRHRLSH
ncbi:MAG TPA: hypothetical protein VMP08_23295 [Anaerolineae bacterium]|nr:hypothetical protein [Anaerolineae bacterium]